MFYKIISVSLKEYYIHAQIYFFIYTSLPFSALFAYFKFYSQTTFHSHTFLDAKYISDEIRRKLNLIALDLIVWIEHAIERNECSVWFEREERKRTKV